MNMFKKLTVASALLAALGVAGSAQAVVFYNGTTTLADWTTDSPVLDVDGDALWSLISNSPELDEARVSLSEVELGGQDFYTAIFDFTSLPEGGLLAGNYSIKYSIQMLDEQLGSVELDTTVVGTHPPDTTVVKNVYSDEEMTQLLTSLTSTNGAPEGPNSISGFTFWVEEIITVGEDMLLESVANDFSTKIPEPGTMLLLGASLLGLARSRRKLSAMV